MIKLKQTITVVALLAMLSMMITILGCSSKQPTSPLGSISQQAEREYDYVPNRNTISLQDVDSDEFDGVFLKTFPLEIGTNVLVHSLDVTANGLELDISYSGKVQVENADVHRYLTVSPTLSNFRLTDQTGELLFEYVIQANQNSTSTAVRISTSNDTFRISIDQSTGRTVYDLNFGESVVDFASTVELERSSQLYYNTDVASIDGLSAADFVAYDKAASLAELYQTRNSFYDNPEAELAAHLIGDSDFLEWLGSKSPVWATDNIFCDAAGLISIASCPWVSVGWPALICFPATGIALACGTANIINYFF